MSRWRKAAVKPWYMKKLAPPDFVHGKDGFGNVDLPPPKGQPVPQHAAAFIVETVMAHSGEVTLVVLGPMTNVALALALEPEVPKHVKAVVAMGGVLEVMGNVSPVASANILGRSPRRGYRSRNRLERDPRTGRHDAISQDNGTIS